MPDLSHKAVRKFWAEYPDAMLYKVITFMEGVEDWTYDGDEIIENSLEILGTTLEKIGNLDIKKEEKIIKKACDLKLGRGLRILMCLDQAYPGAASKILSYAEENTESDSDTAGIFLRRNIVFERLRLLGRIFSQDRMNMISQALESASYEN